jgi:hypothetical protein
VVSAATGRDEKWEALVKRMETSESVTERLNGSLLRSVLPSIAMQLRAGTSKQRLLFVTREQVAPEKLYVLASFINDDTYEFVLADREAVRKADRCSGAIRVEVLEGFLRDLLTMSSLAGGTEEVKQEEVAEAETLVEPLPAQMEGWVIP